MSGFSLRDGPSLTLSASEGAIMNPIGVSGFIGSRIYGVGLGFRVSDLWGCYKTAALNPVTPTAENQP